MAMVRKKNVERADLSSDLKRKQVFSAKGSSVVGALIEKPTIFEMFDCPQCGCQNAVGIYEKPIEESQ